MTNRRPKAGRDRQAVLLAVVLLLGLPCLVRGAETRRILQVPYSHQFRTGWCLFNSLAMAARYFGEDVHALDGARFWNRGPDEGGFTHPWLGEFLDWFNADSISRFLDEYGLDGDWILTGHGSFSTYRDAIDDGHPLIVAGKGHAVVVIGYRDDADRSLYIHDPSGAVFRVRDLAPGESYLPASELVFQEVAWSDFRSTYDLDDLVHKPFSLIEVSSPESFAPPLGSLYFSTELDDAPLLARGDVYLSWLLLSNRDAYRPNGDSGTVELPRASSFRLALRTWVGNPAASLEADGSVSGETRSYRVEIELRQEEDETALKLDQEIGPVDVLSPELATIEVPGTLWRALDDGTYDLYFRLWGREADGASEVLSDLAGPFEVRICSVGAGAWVDLYDDVALQGAGQDEQEDLISSFLPSSHNEIEAAVHAHLRTHGDGWSWSFDLDAGARGSGWMQDTGRSRLEFKVEVTGSDGTTHLSFEDCPWTSTDDDGDGVFGDPSPRGGGIPVIEAGSRIPGEPPATVTFRVKARLDENDLNPLSGWNETGPLDAVTISWPPPDRGVQWTSPAAGDFLEVGEPVALEWEEVGDDLGSLVIDISPDGGATWDALTEVEPGHRRWDWTVSGEASTRCLVRIASTEWPDVRDETAGAFAIGSSTLEITSPATGSGWVVGEPGLIEWRATGRVPEAVRVELRRGAGAPWEAIAARTTASSIEWDVSGPAASGCVIRLSDADESARFDTSEPFAISRFCEGHDLLVSFVESNQPSVDPGGGATIHANVSNRGSVDEEDVAVRMLVSGPAGYVCESDQEIASLDAGRMVPVSFEWPGSAAGCDAPTLEGVYRVVIRATSSAGCDETPEDNEGATEILVGEAPAHAAYRVRQVTFESPGDVEVVDGRTVRYVTYSNGKYQLDIDGVLEWYSTRFSHRTADGDFIFWHDFWIHGGGGCVLYMGSSRDASGFVEYTASVRSGDVARFQARYDLDIRREYGADGVDDAFRIDKDEEFPGDPDDRGDILEVETTGLASGTYPFAILAEAPGTERLYDLLLGILEVRPTRTLRLHRAGPGTGFVEVGGSRVSLPFSGRFDVGESVEVRAVPSGSSRFGGWAELESSLENPVRVVMGSDRELTARFLDGGYSLEIRVEPEGAGEVLRSPEPPEGGTYAAGAEVSLSAAPRPGFRFLGWIGADASGNTTATVTMDRHRLVTASFGPVDLRLVVPSDDADGTFVVSWNEVGGASGYQLDESLTGEFEGEELPVHDGDSNHVLLTGRPDGSRLFYRARPVYGAAVGEWVYSPVACLVTYSRVLIAGTVSREVGVGLPGVEVAFVPEGGEEVLVTTDERGRYACAVPLGWAGRVEPRHESFAFRPESRSIDDARDDRFGEDFLAASGASFVRGDANSDSGINIGDVVFTLNHLFRGGPTPPCRDAADADDSGVLDLTDAVFTLRAIFQGGSAPPAPYPGCGVDPSEDPLGCDVVPVRCE